MVDEKGGAYGRRLKGEGLRRETAATIVDDRQRYSSRTEGRAGSPPPVGTIN
ncbi:MAG: hypothetical protein H8K03_04035 [Nitrospira sp.]